MSGMSDLPTQANTLSPHSGEYIVTLESTSNGMAFRCIVLSSTGKVVAHCGEVTRSEDTIATLDASQQYRWREGVGITVSVFNLQVL